MNRLIMGLAAFATIATAMPAFTAAANAQPVDHREAVQQARIAQGVRSGELPPRQTAHLERREAHLQRQEARMRARHGGVLTRHDRRVLARHENHLSRAIYRAKHNA
jgi:hypothetical protein